MEQFLIALCGLPSSGKTTLAQAIASSLSPQDIKVVSTDRWRDKEYYEDFRPSREQMVRRRAFEETEAALKRGSNVIHDDTNYYASMRHELLELARNHETLFGIIHVATPADTAVLWNNERDSFIPEMVIRRIEERMDTPGERYSWDEPILSMDLSVMDLESATREAVEALEGLRTIERDDCERETQSKNDRIDSLTRDIVAQFLETHKELRGEPKVSTIRRDVARGAINAEIPVEEVQQALLERLRELL
ncbi:hypothetical protein EU538_03575 [Candidatus Thorarchaeota archaeon]|nr:MAG: hypothetical protein EU538_03575 [Candidatus Thorarchaeota archaeon]